MIRKTGYSTLLVSLFLSFAVHAQTTQPGRTKGQLTFEKSKEFRRFFSPSISGHGPVTPCFCVVVEVFENRVERPKSFDDLGQNNFWEKEVQKSSFWPLMSEEQRHYMKISGTYGFASEYGWRRIDYKDQHTQKAIMFAVSEKDAKLMADALVEIMNKLHHENLIQAQKELERFTRLAKENKDQVIKLNDDLKKMKAEISTLQATFHYTNPEPAFTEFVEMDKLVRVIAIDLAGANARMEAIKEMDKKVGEGNTRALLDQKRVDLNIEMAGLLARKKAAENNRDLARKYYDLLKRVETAELTIRIVTAAFQDNAAYAARMKATLANLPANMKPLSVIDNKAVISPWASPSSGR
jgi:hypothetical protein